jgi:hypothetical protein
MPATNGSPFNGMERLDAADMIESMEMELAAAEVSLSLAHELEMQQADEPARGTRPKLLAYDLDPPATARMIPVKRDRGTTV